MNYHRLLFYLRLIFVCCVCLVKGHTQIGRSGVQWYNDHTSWQSCLYYANNLPYLHQHQYTKQRYYSPTDITGSCTKATAEDKFAKGDEVRKGKHPYMVLLGYGKYVRSAQWLCAGTIVGHWTILTAAHCTSMPDLGAPTFAAIGAWIPSAPKEVWQIYNIQDTDVIPHPDYKAPSRYHDLAIMKVQKPFEFNYGGLPACLPSEPKHDPPLDLGDEYALSWGTYKPKIHLADLLKQINLKKVSDEECATTFKEYLPEGFNSTTLACYRDQDLEQSKDDCLSEGGGPVLRASAASPDLKTVVGVVSRGAECGRGAPRLYTRVEPYLPWIESTIYF